MKMHQTGQKISSFHNSIVLYDLLPQAARAEYYLAETDVSFRQTLCCKRLRWWERNANQPRAVHFCSIGSISFHPREQHIHTSLFVSFCV